MPLVRDCSCRGNAHFSCLTKYAEQKCKQMETALLREPCRDDDDPTEQDTSHYP